MKNILLFIFICLAGSRTMAQHVYPIRADSVRIYSNCDTAELIIENRTKDTLGFLYNKGNGRTEFRKLHLQAINGNAIAITGQDTLKLNTIIRTAVDTIYTSGNILSYRKTDGTVVNVPLDLSTWGDGRYDLLSTNYAAIPAGSSMLYDQWPGHKVVGYEAYNATDMPVLSDQAFQGKGTKTYYNGLMFKGSNSSSGFDMALNWDGELNGPNGMFVRTKDDTQTSWSNWRELLFKDYADSHYSLAASSSDYVKGGAYTANTDFNSLISSGFMGSTNAVSNAPVTGETWWNLITSRHRNGLEDGNRHGMQIAGGMVNFPNRMFFRSQVDNTWNSWKEFWHSGNVTFGLNGSNIALKTEINGVLAVENWVRVNTYNGIYTPDGAYLYREVGNGWAVRSGTGNPTVRLELQTGDGLGKGGLYYDGSISSIGIANASNVFQLRIDASSNVYVTGQLRATAFIQTSLRSLKKDIQPFEGNALRILNATNVRTFIYKSDSENIKHIGFIADEIPDEMSSTGHEGVDHSNTVALLVKALQEMTAKVEAMERRIEVLEKTAEK